MFTPPQIIIAVVVIAAMIFIPILRRLLGLIIRLAVFQTGKTNKDAAKRPQTYLLLSCGTKTQKKLLIF